MIKESENADVKYFIFNSYSIIVEFGFGKVAGHLTGLFGIPTTQDALS